MTDEERSEVAAGLRGLAEATARLPMPDSNLYSLLSGVVFNGADWDIHDRNPNGLFLNRLADLIEPEERTCHIEPLSLREFFAGERYVLTSEAMESAEDERFDRLSRELEEDAHFTCSSCHALFGTREVANADYDILEDGTYEVSGVAPIIKFCPYCGAKVIHDA